MSYSEIVLDHFYRPRNQSVMEGADVKGVAGDPERGNFMVLFLKLAGTSIEKASFQTHGCAPSIAAGSLLSERLCGSTLQAARSWTEERINETLGGLPPHKRYCSALAAAALASALNEQEHRSATKEIV
jgi:nitrogen fixation NifU-like protein